ncbi:hypothetical protein [Paludisphaera sp.]|uniref:hypothetical protein n=1 Tax=Paludisphaera sp. TaxID=2017432 RepID=UPI00301E34BF
MPFPTIWLVVAASLLATSLLAATGVLVLARRLAAMARSGESVEQRLAQLSFEVRRLERLVAEAGRRGGASSPARASAPIASLISVPDLARDGEPADAPGLAEKHGEVWTLVEAGRSPREIADETGRPIGEVELIAGLYRQRLAAHPQGRHADA